MPERGKRNHLWRVWLSEAERERLHELAREAGVTAAEWFRRALYAERRPDDVRMSSPVTVPADAWGGPQGLPGSHPAVSALTVSIPGLRRASELVPPAPRSAAERQRLDATVTYELQHGTEPKAIIALLADSYSEPEVRAAIARRDSAA